MTWGRHRGGIDAAALQRDLAQYEAMRAQLYEAESAVLSEMQVLGLSIGEAAIVQARHERITRQAQRDFVRIVWRGRWYGDGI